MPSSDLSMLLSYINYWKLSNICYWPNKQIQIGKFTDEVFEHLHLRTRTALKCFYYYNNKTVSCILHSVYSITTVGFHLYGLLLQSYSRLRKTSVISAKSYNILEANILPFTHQQHQSTESDWVKVLRLIQHKIGHFGDVLPSQSLGLVLKNKNKQQTQACIYSKIYYNIKLTQKNLSYVWLPPTTSGLETEWVYSGRRSGIKWVRM